jgi:hypothetical protein
VTRLPFKNALPRYLISFDLENGGSVPLFNRKQGISLMIPGSLFFDIRLPLGKFWKIGQVKYIGKLIYVLQNNINLFFYLF